MIFPNSIPVYYNIIFIGIFIGLFFLHALKNKPISELLTNHNALLSIMYISK